jgi:N-sulfoglucosamine sulfohydrolase
MERRKFIRTLSGAALASVCLGAGSAVSCGRGSFAPAGPDRPNVILLIADDLGWKDLGCYGDRQAVSPNIDRLASEGTRFTNAFVVASSCSPSRASLITGQYPHTSGTTGLTHVHKRLMLSPFKLTLAETLCARGYNTAIEGKWHVAPYFPTGWYGYRQRLSGMLPKDMWIRSADKACAFIEENRNNAFYLELDYMDTHRDDFGEFQFADGFPFDPDEIAVPDYYALPDWPEIRTELAKYYSNAAKMDAMIGAVLAKLDELGLTENTLVCFVSDNGPPVPGNKMTLYDRGIGAPLVFRWPGRIPAGAVHDGSISTIDIMPTLLEAAGCAVPEAVQGRSALPLVTGQSDEPLRDAVFAEMTYHVHYLPTRAVRTPQWKYIRNYSDDAVGLDQCSHMPWAQRLCELPDQPWTRPRAPEELYDLESDPNEQRNLIEDPAYASQAQAMRALLDDHMRATADPYLGKPFERNYLAENLHDKA